MNLHRYRRQVGGVLPFLERILRTGRYTIIFPRTDGQNTRIQTPRVARRNNCRTKRTTEEHETEVKETMKKLEDANFSKK